MMLIGKPIMLFFCLHPVFELMGSESDKVLGLDIVNGRIDYHAWPFSVSITLVKIKVLFLFQREDILV
jgi:hypothetical protein